METTSVNLVKWLTSLKPTDKLFAVMAFTILALSTVCIKIYGQNTVLQAENLIATRECEQRAANLLIIQMRASDSLLRQQRNEINKECEEEKQRIYLNRTELVKSRNNKIEKALK